MSQPLLVEIGCEELPARLIDQQLTLLADGLGQRLANAGLVESIDGIEQLGTPRRLAVRIPSVAARQADQVLERKGPAVEVAFDAEGKPTRAAEGFAGSVGLSVAQLETLETDQGRWLFARVEQPGQSLEQLLPEMLAETVRSMAGARSMRWSDRDDKFLRPVRWLVALHGAEVVPVSLFGLEAGRTTMGHRTHAPGYREIEHADRYVDVLKSVYVLANPADRRRQIGEQCQALADQAGLEVLIGEGLLDELAGLTEWPVAVMGRFDPGFLEVPEEALISSMEQHQKCFALRDGQGRLAARFLAVANIESRDPAAMTAGFERVIHPRLADARFFWNQDRRTPLADKRPRLGEVLFQEKLGSVGDKVGRLESLAMALAERLDVDPAATRRAAGLCKCDLVTEMVGEFPELQGIMGMHYARADGEDEAVALAIASHYQPRQSGDELPADGPGQALALADRLDTLVGIFAAGQRPKGGKDPFALRRAALGVVRLLDHTACPASLEELVSLAARTLAEQVEVDTTLCAEVVAFIMERLRPWAAEQGIETNTVHAVAAGRTGSVADFMARARAVQGFADDPAGASLIAANKRASNLLKQAEEEEIGEVDDNSLQIQEEKALFKAIRQAEGQLDALLERLDYAGALARLATLREPVDHFFEAVMVMTDDAALRRNRLALLQALRAQFLRVADVARLGR